MIYFVKMSAENWNNAAKVASVFAQSALKKAHYSETSIKQIPLGPSKVSNL